MSLGMYKPGQGYWTRLMTAIGGGTVIGATAMWLWAELETVHVDFPVIYLQGSVAMLIFIVGGAFVYWLTYAKPSTSEFLIATEGEMKKVNWSSRREILGSTWVVIAISFIIAVLLFVVDIGFSKFFQAIKVLQQG